MFTMRFDMRAPRTGAPAPELYAAALEMASWAESRGCAIAILSEHHASGDGYLPSPVVVASAMAARTSTLQIMVAVVLLPLYDPIRLAEEMVVTDIISGGRVSYVAAIGYRQVEYDMYGIDFAERGRIADQKLEILLLAKSGEPFELDGRTIRIEPSPVTAGGPSISWGGGSAAAARRAGRFGIGFLGQGSSQDLKEIYEREALENDHEPVMCFVPDPDEPLTMFVSDDLDKAWEELGPYLMHDVRSYASWNPGDLETASLSHAETAEELRAEGRSHVIVTVDEAVERIEGGSMLALHPLIGGLPPEIAWRYLRTVTDVVIPSIG
jgi:alkanesulfonate monooxygenase SsuD/methylene tetrahydromethanopterin reductase-like flavin-dependent oxidoreductase (luciferase family)